MGTRRDWVKLGLPVARLTWWKTLARGAQPFVPVHSSVSHFRPDYCLSHRSCSLPDCAVAVHSIVFYLANTGRTTNQKGEDGLCRKIRLWAGALANVQGKVQEKPARKERTTCGNRRRVAPAETRNDLFPFSHVHVHVHLPSGHASPQNVSSSKRIPRVIRVTLDFLSTYFSPSIGLTCPFAVLTPHQSSWALSACARVLNPLPHETTLVPIDLGLSCGMFT